ncbi:MAG: hypothetical protein LJE65_10290 [Desulfobacteraceae bacterium]|jgi:hypothetical protein|nr:hypothetical protein [Desulfobacteraceae bacterium]
MTMRMEDLQGDLDLLNEIDWDMGPADAVTMYLEWGNNPALGKRNVRSKSDSSTYFVVNTWKDPVIYLIRRDSESAEELAEIKMPEEIEARFLESIGHNKGVYSLEGEVKEWLRARLYEA